MGFGHRRDEDLRTFGHARGDVRSELPAHARPHLPALRLAMPPPTARGLGLGSDSGQGRVRVGVGVSYPHRALVSRKHLGEHGHERRRRRARRKEYVQLQARYQLKLIAAGFAQRDGVRENRSLLIDARSLIDQWSHGSGERWYGATAGTRSDRTRRLVRSGHDQEGRCKRHSGGFRLPWMQTATRDLQGR